MKKIPSVFQRNLEGDHLVRDEVTPGCEWVLAGEGVATRKWDGTACMVKNGLLYKRYDAKNGKVPPIGFIPAQEPDPKTGHWPGWIVVGNSKADQWHREAFDSLTPIHGGYPLLDGTYELCGPKIGGNHEGLPVHLFVRHGVATYPDVPRDFESLKEFLRYFRGEGLVFRHPDGRMAKVKRRDFFREEGKR